MRDRRCKVGSRSQRERKSYAADFEDGGRGQEPRDVGASRKVKGMDSFLKPPARMQACRHLDFSSLKIILDFCPPEV